MDLVFWNIRGMNGAIKKVEVISLVKRKAAKLFCIVETKISENDHAQVFQDMFPGWRLYANYACYEKGRIWGCWNPKFLYVTLLSMTNQAVHVRICYGEPRQDFVVSFVYGEYSFSKREEISRTGNSMEIMFTKENNARKLTMLKNMKNPKDGDLTSGFQHIPRRTNAPDFNAHQKPKTLEFLCFEMGRNRRRTVEERRGCNPDGDGEWRRLMKNGCVRLKMKQERAGLERERHVWSG
ncbi:hypothetical protein Droror1_Dr00003659 [Drosera rotundifolia]